MKGTLAGSPSTSLYSRCHKAAKQQKPGWCDGTTDQLLERGLELAHVPPRCPNGQGARHGDSRFLRVWGQEDYAIRQRGTPRFHDNRSCRFGNSGCQSRECRRPPDLGFPALSRSHHTVQADKESASDHHARDTFNR